MNLSSKEPKKSNERFGSSVARRPDLALEEQHPNHHAPADHGAAKITLISAEGSGLRNNGAESQSLDEDQLIAQRKQV